MYKALKVVGTYVQVDVSTFREILEDKKEGLVTTSRVGYFSKRYIFQVVHRGLTFTVFSKESFSIPDEFELVVADKIMSPLM